MCSHASIFYTLDTSLNTKKALLSLMFFFPSEKTSPGMDLVIQENFDFTPELNSIAGGRWSKTIQRLHSNRKKDESIILTQLFNYHPD